MDFNAAINSHIQWKVNLRVYLRSPDKSLNLELIEKDDKCELGKWIYEEGTKFKDHPSYKKLLVDHIEFHKCAAEIVKEADMSESKDFEKIENSENFLKLSNLVNLIVTHIREIRESIERG